jgi:hypothetical protein
MTATTSTADLLREARSAGLRVQAQGGKLVVRGPKTAGALAKALLDRKPEVLATLGQAPAVPAWDQAAAERLLAELRAEVGRASAWDFGGQPPPLFRTVAADLLAIAEGYVRHHDLEASRGWDALELLRELKPVLRSVLVNVKALADPASG